MKILNKRKVLMLGIVGTMLITNNAFGMSCIYASDRALKKGSMDLELLVPELGKEVSKEYIQPNLGKGNTKSIPKKFDLRKSKKVSAVKNQAPWELGMVFGVIAGLESNVLMRNKGASMPDYSELQLAWNMFEKQTKKSLKDNQVSLKQVGEGTGTILTGNGRLNIKNTTKNAIASLAAWQGGANEADIPYQAQDGSMDSKKNWAVPVNKRKLSAVQLKHALFLPKPVTLKYTDKIGYEFNENVALEMKQAIMTNGALSIEYHADKANGNYFDSKNFALYVSDLTQLTAPNHNATIVGWDDTFSSNKFKTAHRPQGDGAWLVKNSKGSTWGDNGYFWISYYDRTISQITSLQTQPTNTYDKNYQYDFLGLASGDNFINGYSDRKERIANVFTVDTDEQLKAVSATTAVPNTTVHTEIYKLDTATSKPIAKGATPVSKQSDSFAYAGYHTIALNNAVSLKKGETFSVVQTITHVKDGKHVYQLPIEVGDTDLHQSAVINANESYLIEGDKQTDLYDLATACSSKILKTGNAMIKAFTVKALVLTKEDVTVRDFNTHLAAKTQLMVNKVTSGAAFDAIQDAVTQLGGANTMVIRNIALQPGLGANQCVEVSIALGQRFIRPEQTALYYAKLVNDKATLIKITDTAKDPRMMSGDVTSMGYFVIFEKKLDASLPKLKNITYDPRQTLATIKIPDEGHGTWAWEDSSIVPTVNVHSYTALFTPNEHSGILAYKVDIPLTTEKATVNITTNASPIVYGQTLSNATLTGEALLGTSKVDGKFTWEDTAIVPTVKDTMKDYMVLFTPTDRINYHVARITQKVSVAKKAISLTVNNASKFYGDPNPQFAYTVPQGVLVGHDTNDVINVSLISRVNEKTDVGNYTIYGLAEADNYLVSVVTGTLEVMKRPLRVNIDTIYHAYGELLPTNFPYKIANLVNGDTEESIHSKVEIEVVGAAKEMNVGTYKLKVKSFGVSSNNYIAMDKQSSAMLIIVPNCIKKVTDSPNIGDHASVFEHKENIAKSSDIIIKALTDQEAIDAFKAYTPKHMRLDTMFDLSVPSYDKTKGKLTLRIPVDKKYNGQKVTILHYIHKGKLTSKREEAKRGMVDPYIGVIVKEGIAEVDVFDLSPFAILVSADTISVHEQMRSTMYKAPFTADTTASTLFVRFLFGSLFSIVFIVICKIVSNKRKVE